MRIADGSPRTRPVAARTVRRARRCIPGGGEPLLVPAAPMGSDRRSGANGTLRVRASILNTAAQLQPYPLLRVTLANRFGSAHRRARFRARGIHGQAHRAHARARREGRCDARHLGSGKDAEGFEIDVCLRGIDRESRAPAMLRRTTQPETMTVKIGPHVRCDPTSCSLRWRA